MNSAGIYYEIFHLNPQEKEIIKKLLVIPQIQIQKVENFYLK